VTLISFRIRPDPDRLREVIRFACPDSCASKRCHCDADREQK